jgi:hypothetical protein
VLDDDVAFLARELAASSRRSVGQVIPDLARRGYQSERQQSLAQAPGGGEFPQLPSRGGTVTNEQVNRLREELGI